MHKPDDAVAGNLATAMMMLESCHAHGCPYDPNVLIEAALYFTQVARCAYLGQDQPEYDEDSVRLMLKMTEAVAA